MRNNRRILKEGAEDVRGGKEMQAQVEDVPKGPGTKGKPVVGIRRKDLGREDNPKDRRKRVCDGDPGSKVKDHRSTSVIEAKIGRAPKEV